MPFDISKLKKQTELEMRPARSDYMWLLKGLVGVAILIAMLHPPHCGESDLEEKKTGSVSTTETETSDEEVAKTSEHRPRRYGWGIRRASRRTAPLK
jgi:hypothetical protein